MAILTEKEICILREVLLTQTEISCFHDMLECIEFGSPRSQYIPERLNIEVFLNLRAQKYERAEGKYSLSDFGLVDHMTIRELFKAIQGKIKERK